MAAEIHLVLEGFGTSDKEEEIRGLDSAVMAAIFVMMRTIRHTWFGNICLVRRLYQLGVMLLALKLYVRSFTVRSTSSSFDLVLI